MSSAAAPSASAGPKSVAPAFDFSASGWDRVAQKNTDETELITGPHGARILERLQEKFTDGKAILADIACGGGAVALRAATMTDTFGEILASDHSPAMCAIVDREAAKLAANSKTVPVRTLVANMEQLAAIPTGSVDAAVSTFGVMILPAPRAAFEELLRITKPGGYIGVTAWCAPAYSQFHSLFGALSRHVAGKAAEKAAATGEAALPSIPIASPQFQYNTVDKVRDLFTSLGLEEELIETRTSTSRVQHGVADFWISNNRAMPVREKTDDENRWAIDFLSNLFGEHATFQTSFTAIVAIARKPL